ncbi:MAG: response regulator transcription factor [Candidatus Woesearchaeota archaeon]
MKTVLIVEDEENIAEAEKMILEDVFTVHVANDGEEGLRLAKEVKPDVIVLDLMLPKVDGLDVCKQIKAIPELSATKVVMVTAKNQQIDEEEGLDVGADDYIMKPFEPIELVHVITQVLEKEIREAEKSE